MTFRKEVSATVTDPADPLDPDRVDATLTKTSLMATVLAYPSSTGSFFFQAGLGYGRQEVSTEVEDVRIAVSRDLLAVDLGVGHDFQLGDGNLYLIPNVDAMLHVPDLEIGSTDATFLFTVGIGFR